MELDVTQALVVDLDDSVHDLEPPVVEDAPAGLDSLDHQAKVTATGVVVGNHVDAQGTVDVGQNHEPSAVPG